MDTTKELVDRLTEADPADAPDLADRLAQLLAALLEEPPGLGEAPASDE